MVGDPSRGPLLELFFTKLRTSCPHTQLIGLSATLPNLDELCSWLGARLYATTYRPVPLMERIKVVCLHTCHRVSLGIVDVHELHARKHVSVRSSHATRQQAIRCMSQHDTCVCHHAPQGPKVYGTDGHVTLDASTRKDVIEYDQTGLTPDKDHVSGCQVYVMWSCNVMSCAVHVMRCDVILCNVMRCHVM